MAKRQEVLLVEDVLKLGNMGDIVRVPPGYARNYLFPYRLAIPVSQAHKRQVEVLREKAAKSEAEREAKAIAQKRTVDGLTIQIPARVAHDLELFGSIGTREIVQALDAKGVKVDGKQVHLTDKLKRLGVYTIEVSLHKKVPVSIKVEVVNSDPNAPSLADTLAAYAEAQARAKEEAKKAKEAAKDGGEAAPAEGEKKDAKAEAKPAESGKAKAEGGKKDAKAEGAPKGKK